MIKDINNINFIIKMILYCFLFNGYVNKINIF